MITKGKGGGYGTFVLVNYRRKQNNGEEELLISVTSVISC